MAEHGGSRDGVSRRGFLAAGAIGGAAITLPVRRSAARPPRLTTAANLIFMVADGMSAGTLAMGDLLHRRLYGKRSRWVELMEHERVTRAMIDTQSADSMVTDSAASSTAWSVGSLVNNGSIGVLPDGTPVSPLLMRAKEGGRATGLVTTTRVTHATPAGFSANTRDRDHEGEIAGQLLDRKYDLVIGGGAKFFADKPLDGFRVARTRAEMLATPPDEKANILGLFSDSHMAFEIERPESQPSIEEMTRFAIRTLSARTGGFVLQIEGGRVDHAGHNNDAAGLLYDQLAFDKAVNAAAEFALGRDDTLLIITTDHGTANPALTDYTGAGAAGFDLALGLKHSFEWIESMVSKSTDRSAAAIAQIVDQATGIAVREDEAALLSRWVAGEKIDPFRLANAKFGPLGSILANHLAIAFLSPNHTCDFVELTALGPSSYRVPPYMAINQVHEIVRVALDLPPAKPV